ncbi:MAG: sugar phosphate isomerase/epimerase, partial [Firmicutes bacterium]|nr:sugar phosphate isomerase/epimerase [Bacillota bacterium]
DNVALLENASYDYLELTMVSLADDEQYRRIQEVVCKSELAVEAFNVLLPGEIKVVGPEVDWDQIYAYIDKVLPRAAALGGEVVVFGSGRSRRVPNGFPKQEARQQVIEFARFLGAQASQYGFVIGIEPLRPAECNLLNYVSETYELVEEIALDGMGITADFYHMVEGDESLGNVVAASCKLAHIHLADSGRMWPGSGTYDYMDFFRNVKAAGYDKRMSLECGWDDFPKNIVDTLAFLRDAWEKANI